ncbi:hypothetical protein V8J88_22460 [Massilia sp. W12]|uniref:hypothetical protein n=1 Tax=Massilia sp. W12 TaxID=3126507 RepID=UPI0030CE5552
MSKNLLAVLLVFVVNMLLSFVQHGIVLHEDYGALPQVMRSEQESQAYFGWLLAGQFLLSVSFVWLYRSFGKELPWPRRGVRFGIAATLLAWWPNHMIYHAVAKFPQELMFKQLALDAFVMLAMGLSLAWFLRKE